MFEKQTHELDKDFSGGLPGTFVVTRGAWGGGWRLGVARRTLERSLVEISKDNWLELGPKIIDS